MSTSTAPIMPSNGAANLDPLDAGEEKHWPQNDNPNQLC
jgi:hypothetical protein